MADLSAEVSRVLELLERCPSDGCRSGLVVDFVPLDEHLRPCGSSQTAVTRELSQDCIGLLAEAPAGTRYLRISLPGAREMTVLSEVLRCERFGCFFEITARVLAGHPQPNPARQEPMRGRRQGVRGAGIIHSREGLPVSAVGAL